MYPRTNDFAKITDRLNNIEPTIDFTYELENNNNNLSFLNILLINNNNKLTICYHFWTIYW